MIIRVVVQFGCIVLAVLTLTAQGRPGDWKTAQDVATISTFQPGREPGQDKTAPAVNHQGPTIKDVYKDHFLIGMAGDIPGNYSEAEMGLVKEHFNVVTPENCMKPGLVHPSEDSWS